MGLIPCDGLRAFGTSAASLDWGRVTEGMGASRMVVLKPVKHGRTESGGHVDAAGGQFASHSLLFMEGDDARVEVEICWL